MLKGQLLVEINGVTIIDSNGFTYSSKKFYITEKTWYTITEVKNNLTKEVKYINVRKKPRYKGEISVGKDFASWDDARNGYKNVKLKNFITEFENRNK